MLLPEGLYSGLLLRYQVSQYIFQIRRGSAGMPSSKNKTRCIPVPWQQKKQQSSKTSVSQMISLHLAAGYLEEPQCKFYRLHLICQPCNITRKTILRFSFPSGAGSFNLQKRKYKLFAEVKVTCGTVPAWIERTGTPPLTEKFLYLNS